MGMRILDIARVWIGRRDSSRYWEDEGWGYLAQCTHDESEMDKAEILARLAALQVSA